MPTITIGSTTIPYAIEERPRRRHVSVQIDAARRVTVLIPRGFDSQRIETLLHSKARWLVQHFTALPDRPAPPTKEFVSGEQFWLQGQPLQLQVQSHNDSEPQVLLAGSHLVVRMPSSSIPVYPIRIRELLVQWYTRQAFALVSQRINYYAPQLKVYPYQLKIAEYKSRWGFYRTDGLIAFNWQIVQAPLPVIDYVVVHELMHDRYPHHRPAFWNAVQAILPDFAKQKQWLRDHELDLEW